MTETLLRLSDVQQRIPLSKSAIYKLISNGDFPKQIRISHKVSVWRETDINNWICERSVRSKDCRIDGDLAYIPLTQGYEAIVDIDDLPLVASYLWTAHVTLKGNGSVRSVYAYRSALIDGVQRNVRLHRFLMNAPDDVEVDHINGNGLDCRRENLRLATRTQNAQNKRLGTRNTSGFKGVSWHKATRKWCAQIVSDGKKQSLGYYERREDAAAAYAAASKKLHGEFGRTA